MCAMPSDLNIRRRFAPVCSLLGQWRVATHTGNEVEVVAMVGFHWTEDVALLLLLILPHEPIVASHHILFHRVIENIKKHKDHAGVSDILGGSRTVRGGQNGESSETQWLAQTWYLQKIGLRQTEGNRSCGPSWHQA